MNSPSDTGSAAPEAAAGSHHSRRDSPPTNWREALMALIASRVSLIQLESKDAAKQITRRAVLVFAAGCCAIASWALVLAGGVVLISEISGWPWSWVALAGALLHLVAGVVLARLALKRPSEPAFPITRAEFTKDREWIENFQKTPKSSD